MKIFGYLDDFINLVNGFLIHLPIGLRIVVYTVITMVIIYYLLQIRHITKD